MRTTIGIDTQGEYKSALHLFANLKFRNASVTFVHAASPVTPFVPIGYAPAMAAQVDYADAVAEIGQKALTDACALGESLGLQCDSRMVLGSPADVLINSGEEADLIAVGAAKRGRWAGTFLGSVSRSLAIGSRCSLLIAKGPVEETKPLTAVLATDHSEYAGRWVDKFLSLRPEGINKIHVLTAYELGDEESRILQMSLPMLGDQIDEVIEEKLREKNDALVKKLQEWGYEAEASIVRTEPKAAIRTSMEQTHADLLIMGAQGHGFLERLMIGSVSLHQVMIEPYPVLVVRA
jgi:nucleotide-binding universal stress UspA family protein